MIREAADTNGIENVNDHATWERALLDFIHSDAVTEIGEEPSHVERELVRHTQRTHERMSWARRTYRQWAANHMQQTRSAIRSNTRIRPQQPD